MAERKKVTHPKGRERVKVSGEAQKALAAIAGELAALEADDVLRVNVDVARAVSIVLGSEPKLLAYESEINDVLPNHDVSKLSKLRTYALAALYAHLDAQTVPQRTDLTVMIKEGTALKQTLIIAADALAHAGLVDGERLAEIKRGSGHLDLASDLVALSALFDVSWNQIEGKTFVQSADVERASTLGTTLLVAIGAKNHSENRASPEVLDRKHRAFTLLFRAYDEARRALSYLRWHEGDVELIAPSLYQKTRRRVRKVDETEEVDPVEEDDGDVDDSDAEPEVDELEEEVPEGDVNAAE